MRWPSGQEYSEVIQNPRLAFENDELRGGRIETDQLGLPRPRSGNFAVVYKVDCPTRSWAVKCFTREVPDHQRRYAKISAHLQGGIIPHTVGFDYLTRGIRVRGEWFPILKMEWVAGDPLISYIEKRLRDPGSIRALARRWAAMVKTLRSAGVSHGDLQHGNVLVVGGDLRLVDYDGMFVPALVGECQNEFGHPNYQHPGRKSLHFGPDLDNFAAWSIYVSLVAISIDPSLWSCSQAGDDCLLFRASDFAAPEQSRVFMALASSPDERLQSLTELFSELVRSRAEEIPPLNSAELSVETVRNQPRGLPSWVKDHLKLGAMTKTWPVITNGQREGDATWVTDLITPEAGPDDVRFQNSVIWLRLNLLCWTILALALVFEIPGRGLVPIVLASLGGIYSRLIAVGYRSEPGVASRRKAQEALSELTRQLEAASDRVAKLPEKRKDASTRHARDIAGLRAKVQTADEMLKGRLDAINRELDRKLAPTQRQIKEIGQEERTALHGISLTSGVRAGQLRGQLNALVPAERSEMAAALSSLQSDHVARVLSSAAISRASIPGIGPHFKSMLIENRVLSASEALRGGFHALPGFGRTRFHAVIAWAKSIEQQARSTMPHYLPVSQAEAIRTKFQEQRRVLALELRQVEEQIRKDEIATRAKFAGMRQEAKDIEAVHRSEAARNIRVIEELRVKLATFQKTKRQN